MPSSISGLVYTWSTSTYLFSIVLLKFYPTLFIFRLFMFLIKGLSLQFPICTQPKRINCRVLHCLFRFLLDKNVAVEVYCYRAQGCDFKSRAKPFNCFAYVCLVFSPNFQVISGLLVTICYTGWDFLFPLENISCQAVYSL